MAKENGLDIESLGLTLPYNMQAEQSVLGAVILKSDILPELIEKLKPEMFYAKQNGQIFGEMLHLFTAGQSVDFVTLLEAVGDANVFESVDAAKVYMTSLAETVPTISNVQAYAKIVREKYMVRQLMLASKEIMEQCSEESDASVLLEKAEQKIYDIRTGRDSGGSLTKLSDVIVDTLVSLQRISGPDKEKYAGIPTGYKYLDKALIGLGRSDLIILAARPGMGKTSFALNIATNVAKQQKIPVAIFSLEMTKDQLTSRILSAEAGIGSQAFRTGELSTADWGDIAHASDILHNAPIFMDDTSGITIPEVKAKVRRINQDTSKPNIGLIIIDYLQLMTSGRHTENRVQEVSEITRNLKIMAKELNVPVVALSQLSRASEKTSGRSDHRPQLSDLRDSGSIEQDADVVMFLYRAAYYNSASGNVEDQADENIAECIIAKNRHGEVNTVKLGWDGAHTRFLDIDFSHMD